MKKKKKNPYWGHTPSNTLDGNITYTAWNMSFGGISSILQLECVSVFLYIYIYIYFFFAHFYFPTSEQAVVTGVVLSPPRFLPSTFFAHRVQQSHCSSIFHRVLLTHALALSASQFVHKKKSQRIYTSMHSAGLELKKLTYTRFEDNLIRHRGDRLHILQGLRKDAAFTGTQSSGRPWKKLELFHPTQTKKLKLKGRPRISSEINSSAGVLCAAVHQNHGEISIALPTCTWTYAYTVLRTQFSFPFLSVWRESCMVGRWRACFIWPSQSSFFYLFPFSRGILFPFFPLCMSILAHARGMFLSPELWLPFYIYLFIYLFCLGFFRCFSLLQGILV